MSQLKKHVDALTKSELDEFATEYYGINLDRRKSKGAMAKKLISDADVTSPLKPLPWEELLVEQLEKEAEVQTDEVQTDEVITDEVQTDEAKTEKVDLVVDQSFEPIPLSFKRGLERFMITTDTAATIAQSIIDGKSSKDGVIKSDVRLVDSILHHVAVSGEVLVRETRNSQFIKIK